MTLLDVIDLSVSFQSKEGLVRAIENLSFSVSRNETLGIIGESGCGKTVTCRQILGLNRGANASGKVLFEDIDLMALRERGLLEVRGSKIAMVFQNPSAALNPVVTIGRQMTEVIRRHRKVTAENAAKSAVRLLGDMGISSPERRMREYAHQQSGGMNQRILIAMAISCEPSLLIADEPTASLDVTTEQQILDLLREIREQRGISIIIVSHNIALVSEIADRVAIMLRGKIVEQGDVSQVFKEPEHEYTRLLLSSVRSFGGAQISSQPKMKASAGPEPGAA
jgi:ABC-type dipeptide/oligopeptide/nickel transport system ATPase component